MNRRFWLLRLGLACALAAATLSGCFLLESRKPLEFTPASLPDAAVGTAYATTITVTEAATPVGGAGVARGSLPGGLALALSEAHYNTMTIAGTPTAAGTFAFTISVWCYGTNVSGQTADHEYTIVVK